jgi:hypothetical protein
MSRLVESLIDRLVTDPHRRPIRVEAGQHVADLLRAPAVGEALLHEQAQLGVGREFSDLGPGAAGTGAFLGPERMYLPVSGSLLRLISRLMVDG